MRLATSWLERCWQVAVWSGDRQAQHRAMVALAKVSETAGNSSRVLWLRRRAGKVAARFGFEQEQDV